MAGQKRECRVGAPVKMNIIDSLLRELIPGLPEIWYETIERVRIC
jgi:hypothetical protein